MGTCCPGEAGGHGLFVALLLCSSTALGHRGPGWETKGRGVPGAHKNKPFKDEGQVERSLPCDCYDGALVKGGGESAQFPTSGEHRAPVQSGG